MIILVIFILVILGYLLYTKSALFTYFGNKYSVRVERDIVYVKDSGDPKHTLDLYLPKDKENFPLVYFVHGGNWNSGDKRYFEPVTGLYGNIGVSLASHGIGVAVANYRLFPDVSADAQILDILDGISWVQEHGREYGAGDNLFLMGHSTGGQMIALLGAQPEFFQAKNIDEEKIRGYLTLSAVWDINEMVQNSKEEYNNKITYPLFGETEGKRRFSSPAAYQDGIQKPFFIAAGERDYPYLIEQARRMHEVLDTRGISNKYLVAPKTSHSGIIIGFGKKGDLLLPAIVNFVQEHSI